MSDFLFQYHEVKPTTWVYLSSLLLIGLFFKFSRLWSVRNLDLVMLILLSPGLLLVHYGKLAHYDQYMHLETASVGGNFGKSPAGSPLFDDQQESAENIGINTGIGESDEIASVAEDAAPTESAVGPGRAVIAGGWMEGAGFVWLFAVGLCLMVRLLFDPTMVRRPLLEPNLSAGGLVFIACSLFVFLMANVVSDSPTSPRLAVTYSSITAAEGAQVLPYRVGYGILWMVPPPVAKTVVIGSHLAIVIGLVVVGFRHFTNTVMGLGAATLYLMLPYSSLLTGRIDHVLPAAALIWAVVCYRRPVLSGVLTAVAGGLVFYPLFLFPLWASFYWQRGLVRYVMGWLGTLATMTVCLLMVSAEPRQSFRLMYGLVSPSSEWVMGAWDSQVTGWDSVYRWPILVAFLVLSLSLALWPAQKNLGTLLSCSAALMVGSQFWHAQDGGIYMAWYLPLVLLTIFRPNLEDRVAVSVLGERRARLRNVLSSVDLAA